MLSCNDQIEIVIEYVFSCYSLVIVTIGEIIHALHCSVFSDSFLSHVHTLGKLSDCDLMLTHKRSEVKSACVGHWFNLRAFFV